MRNARLDEAQAGIKIAGRNISNLRYAPTAGAGVGFKPWPAGCTARASCPAVALTLHLVGVSAGAETETEEEMETRERQRWRQR